MVQFKDRTLLITGGGTGIGEAIAYQFAQRGTNVILTGLGEEQLKKVEERCRQYGVKAWHKEVNLEEPASIDALVEYVGSLGLRPDFFVLNAGISQRALTLDCDISMDRKLMEINYFGGVYLIKKFKEHLKAAKEIHIAVTTSISGLFGFPLRSAYCASKHALFGFYESMELEYPNIKVTFLIPGRIRTEISKSALLASGEKCHSQGEAQETHRRQGAADGLLLQIHPLAVLHPGQKGIGTLIKHKRQIRYGKNHLWHTAGRHRRKECSRVVEMV